MRYKHKKGQAVVEMALFGSLVLLILGSLLSYIQRQNDQQYVQMEAFRRALEKGCTYLGTDSEGAGASVQYTLLQTRKHSDVGGGFRKGSSQTLSGSSNVFWAVPRIAEDEDDDVEPDSLIIFRINDDEKQWKYRDFVPKEHDSTDEDGNDRPGYWSFETEDLETNSELTFAEQNIKEEDTEAITNTRTSQLQETVNITIPYKVTQDDGDDDPDNNPIITEGTLWELTQGLYRDSSGQYRYNSRAVGEVVERGRTWKTGFKDAEE